MIMKKKLRSVLYRTLVLTERAAAKSRALLEQKSRGPSAVVTVHQVERPNQTEEWEQVYADELITPITTLSSPVAHALEKLTKPGDVLLEAGCGSATISAELALAGRNIYLADFSQPILDRAARLFEVSGLPKPTTIFADLTSQLPLPDKSVDIVWSSGVLEHWTDEELLPIVKEMARVSRRGVISLVPNAGSLFYRWGKAVLEEQNRWPYGREWPRGSMQGVFEAAGLSVVHESRIWPEMALEYLGHVDAKFQKLFSEWWSKLPADDAIRDSLGYLLLTVGQPLESDT